MRPWSLVVLAALVVPSAAAAFPWTAEAEPMHRTLGWIRDRTRSDGCMGAEATGSCGHSTTRDMVIVLSALGEDAHAWDPRGADPVTYLREHRADLETEPGDCTACHWAKTIVALEAANEDPRAFGDYDYVARLATYFDGVQIGSPNAINDDAWALFAFAGVEEPPRPMVDSILTFLRARQNSADGGWSWSLSAQSEPWGTATVLLSMLASGVPSSDTGVAKAIAYLRGVPTRGGLILQDAAPSAETTAIAVQALQRAGEDVMAAAWVRDGGSFPESLLSLQGSDGSFAHNAEGGSRFLATTQVPPAMRGLPYPFRPPTLAFQGLPLQAAVGRDLEVNVEAQDPDGGAVTLMWIIDGEGAGTSSAWRGRFLTTGPHHVRVLATDAQGASRWAEAAIDVTSPAIDPTPSSAVDAASTEPDVARPAAATPSSATVPGLDAVSIAVLAVAVAFARRP